MRILYVEDEKNTAKAVAEVLKKNKYSVDLAFDGNYGLDCALSGIYDIIILDIMLPKMDGLSVLKEIRRNALEAPVILLTARGALEEKVQGLDLGADDYLAKPFHTEELLARLRALGRRKPELMPDGKIMFKDIELSPQNLLLSCGKSTVKLTLKESQLLEALIKNTGRTLSKEHLIEKIWGFETDAEDSHVEKHISLLRKKLEKLKSCSCIRTIRNAGYIISCAREGF
ncbi:MAG: response regulator transcription factor [Clostridiales bacterium]|nr:response regulator transcription factor [Clostridiales bacterium]